MLIASAITLSVGGYGGVVTPTLNVIAEAISLIEARVSDLLCSLGSRLDTQLCLG